MTCNLAARAVALCAVLTVAATTGAEASNMPSACSMIPLADVRSTVGAPVKIINDNAPVVAYGVEATNCLYMVSLSGGMSVSVWLGRGPAGQMLAAHRAYAKVPQSRRGAEGLRGSTQVIVRVVTASAAGMAYHDALSAKLLAAVLAKL